jgi:dTDP-4-dehydrorhamnose reductase
MKILVFGADGLLGNTLTRLHPVTPITHAQCDVTDVIRLQAVFEEHKPEVVINCAGITNKANDKTSMEMYDVNSLAPRHIATTCDRFQARLIHISTDCVFSGERGMYHENDTPDPNTVYGKSKLSGEITRYPHLTVRTSFIGLPDNKGRGLLAWSKKQEKVEGYADHFWNGVTTLELARLLISVFLDKTYTGLLHVAGQVYSKYEILTLAKEVLELPFTITPVQKGYCNRTLTSVHHPKLGIPSLSAMLRAMKKII